ncbi:MAG: DUF1080 domain-containing protein [Pirellulales bacterium]|nr:DUF1080 domain-containing protein [Pirellulales bacterium]
MLRRAQFLSAAILMLALATSAAAADQGQAATDPAKAGPDFAVQGEYVGTVPGEKEEMKIGVQVIALGEGKFRAVGHEGGLPGDGWDGKERRAVEGQAVNGVATFSGEDGNWKVTIKDGKLTIVSSEGEQIATLKKVQRKSPTLGAKPPAGAVVLFDGTSADAFEGGHMTKDGLLAEGDTSKQQFQSFQIHLEFRTPFQPTARGQGRGNSGFYAQGRYEVQILDSFGLEGRNNECGGIYGVAEPKVNMCLPPLSWQTYDVDYTAAEYQDGKKVRNAMMTVRHNGVVVHKDQDVPHATTAAPVREGPGPGPIFLQNHGNPVRFRNIWVVEK